MATTPESNKGGKANNGTKPSTGEKTLSTTVRNMRFMARSSESELRQRLVEEQKRSESEAQWRILDSKALQGILRYDP